MNLRLFSIAVLVSALPLLSQADAAKLQLNHADFVAAERVVHDGRTVVNLKLSKSGKAKFRKLNAEAIGQSVHSEIAGVTSDFTLRAAITGDSLEIGPLSPSDAERVVAKINHE